MCFSVNNLRNPQANTRFFFRHYLIKKINRMSIKNFKNLLFLQAGEIEVNQMSANQSIIFNRSNMWLGKLEKMMCHRRYYIRKRVQWFCNEMSCFETSVDFMFLDNVDGERKLKNSGTYFFFLFYELLTSERSSYASTSMVFCGDSTPPKLLGKRASNSAQWYVDAMAAMVRVNKKKKIADKNCAKE